MSQRCDCRRRSFLKGSGVTLAGFSLMSLLPGPLLRHALAAPAAGNGKRMLFIFLRGGNDGLNAVIPHGDPDYYAPVCSCSKKVERSPQHQCVNREEQRRHEWDREEQQHGCGWPYQLSAGGRLRH